DVVAALWSHGDVHRVSVGERHEIADAGANRAGNRRPRLVAAATGEPDHAEETYGSRKWTAHGMFIPVAARWSRRIPQGAPRAFAVDRSSSDRALRLRRGGRALADRAARGTGRAAVDLGHERARRMAGGRRPGRRPRPDGAALRRRRLAT